MKKRGDSKEQSREDETERMGLMRGMRDCRQGQKDSEMQRGRRGLFRGWGLLLRGGCCIGEKRGGGVRNKAGTMVL